MWRLALAVSALYLSLTFCLEELPSLETTSLPTTESDYMDSTPFHDFIEPQDAVPFLLGSNLEDYPDDVLHSPVNQMNPAPYNSSWVPIPYGVLTDNTGHGVKKRCRCIQKKLGNKVKEVRYEPLTKGPIQLQNRNFTCNCGRLRKKPRNKLH